MHVAQPVELALLAKRGQPVYLLRDVHQPGAQVVHRYEPLIHESKHEVRAAAPAHGVAVAVHVCAIEDPLALKVVGNRLCDLTHVHPREEAETLSEHSELIEGSHHIQVVFPRLCEVFLAAAGRYVYYASAFLGAHVRPRDDLVAHRSLGR